MQNGVAAIVDPNHVEFDPEPPRHRSTTYPRFYYVGRFICEVSFYATAEVARLVIKVWVQTDALID